MKRRVIKSKSTTKAKTVKTVPKQSRATRYIVTARFPNGRTIPINAVGEAEKSKAIATIKKHAPSATYTIKTLK